MKDIFLKMKKDHFGDYFPPKNPVNSTIVFLCWGLGTKNENVSRFQPTFITGPSPSLVAKVPPNLLATLGTFYWTFRENGTKKRFNITKIIMPRADSSVISSTAPPKDQDFHCSLKSHLWQPLTLPHPPSWGLARALPNGPSDPTGMYLRSGCLWLKLEWYRKCCLLVNAGDMEDMFQALRGTQIFVF